MTEIELPDVPEPKNLLRRLEAGYIVLFVPGRRSLRCFLRRCKLEIDKDRWEARNHLGVWWRCARCGSEWFG